MLSARDDAVVFETNVEPFVRVEGLESSPKTETDFVPLDNVDEAGVPPPSLGCSRGLNEDLVADQHARALLRQTRDRKATNPSISRLTSKAKIQTNGKAADIRS